MFSITRSVTVSQTDDPIAVAKVCCYHLPLYDRYMAFRQKVSRFTTSSRERAVHSGKDGSVRMRSLPRLLPDRSAFW